MQMLFGICVIYTVSHSFMNFLSTAYCPNEFHEFKTARITTVHSFTARKFAISGKKEKIYLH